MPKKSILERMNDGEVIVGDGGLVYCMERRGYVTIGINTPEVVVEYPDAVRELHREFALCGSDILQAFVFYGTDDKLNFQRDESNRLCVEQINEAGCGLVKEIANEQDCYVAFPITMTTAYAEQQGKEKVQKEFQRQIDVFKMHSPDLVISEFMSAVEEAEWAIELLKQVDAPIAATLCIGLHGDKNDVPVEECAVRLAKAGAHIIGVNCRFSPTTAIETIRKMKAAIDVEGSAVHFMTQPMGYRITGVGKLGAAELPEWPLATESRLISRFEAQKYARSAYEAGVRYIGGCCGFQPYHIRAVAEELYEERDRLPKNSRSMNASSLQHHPLAMFHKKANKDYWYNIVPRDGREEQ